MIDLMVDHSRRSAQICVPTSDITGTSARIMRQHASLSYATRVGRLKQEVGMQGCEQHKLSPDGDGQLCAFRKPIMPIGTTSSEMTLITVRDEKIVTKEEIQDSGQSASERASSSSDTIFIEIPKENVQEMKTGTSLSMTSLMTMTSFRHASHPALT